MGHAHLEQYLPGSGQEGAKDCENNYPGIKHNCLAEVDSSC
jgi:hypothetical protein